MQVNNFPCLTLALPGGSSGSAQNHILQFLLHTGKKASGFSETQHLSALNNQNFFFKLSDLLQM